MSSVAYIQPVFAPDKMRLDRNIDSIRSFGQYIKKFPYPNLHVVMGGYAREEYWAEIVEVIKEHIGPDTPITKFEKNYGKATVVNTLHDKHLKNKNIDFILGADSDIVFDTNCPSVIPRLILCAEKMTEKKGCPFGMVALNQKAQNCHLMNHLTEKFEYDGPFGKESVVWPRGMGGIAGGCIFISSKLWDKVGGYRVMGCYAGDDAYLLVDAMRNGFSIQMMETVHIVHPHEHDEEYAKWKVKVCQRDSGKAKKNIDAQIQEAEEFWNKKNGKE